MAGALEHSFAALAAERDALRRFIADASHELRTPITALRTFCELLLGGAAHDALAQQEFLHESQGQIERLERITNNLLNLSRLEGGLIQLRMAHHNLPDLVQETVAPLRAVAQERGICLRVELPATPAAVLCDRSQLESALTNLVDNALKFTPPGGQVQVGAAVAGGEVSIWVKDNGPGIGADDLPYIFERFHRGRTASGEGSGLGLAIVQSIVQAHGGSVTVVSQEGVGSRFAIRLPIAPVDLSSDEVEPPLETAD
jgi:signal transduction histidine kinase